MLDTIRCAARDLRKSLEALNVRMGAQEIAATTATPAPPVPNNRPSDARYFYGDEQGAERGPFNAASLRQLVEINQLSPTTPVYRSGSEGWATLADFPELV